MRQTETARKHLLAAWALPGRMISLRDLASTTACWAGLLEAVIQPRWPGGLPADHRHHRPFFLGLAADPQSGHRPPGGGQPDFDRVCGGDGWWLRGWTTDEIAAHMKVSASTIKKHQAQIKRKLKIDTWEELEPYMLA